ncbi:flavin reductase family protein [Paenibacillus sp. N1-5-1-14]|uniref:flavin reductase family protein n=1 Tax=Paenibacillus radicibacter TaxID=2972488 RepID=UPI0021594D83|nr:flavin reductase family protein [Paenibacillus radicibacter]MCR8641123.1 flavin reductase family protein [Paenibacillus radicibacter]
MKPMNKNKPNTVVIEPRILYYGNPVILLSTLNEDGTTNVSPLSSSWALGNNVIIGIGLEGKAYENMKRDPECVINIPSPELWEQVEQISHYTGKNPVPTYKQEMGYSYCKDKLEHNALTCIASYEVRPQRILECPLQLEAKVMGDRVPEHAPHFAIIETQVSKVHAHADILLEHQYIDPSKWSPLIYNFRHYFGLGERLGNNRRADV